METRQQVKGGLKAMTIKTDRRDAGAIARLVNLGWYRPVHCKSGSALEVRSVLGARKATHQGIQSPWKCRCVVSRETSD